IRKIDKPNLFTRLLKAKTTKFIVTIFMKRYVFVIGLIVVTTLSCKKENTPGNNNSNSLELVFEDSTYQITGIAKQDNDSLFVNYPRWSATYQYAVVQAQGMTGKVAY